MLAQHMRREDIPSGRAIVTEGDTDDRFYALLSGMAAVAQSSLGPRRVLRPGDTFGEVAVVMGIPRTATVTSITPCTVASCDRETFNEHLRGLFADDGPSNGKRPLSDRRRGPIHHGWNHDRLSRRAESSSGRPALADPRLERGRRYVEHLAEPDRPAGDTSRRRGLHLAPPRAARRGRRERDDSPEDGARLHELAAAFGSTAGSAGQLRAASTSSSARPGGSSARSTQRPRAPRRGGPAGASQLQHPRR